MTDETLEILIKDVDEFKKAIKEHGLESYPHTWRSDIDNAPTDTWLLLRNKIGDGKVYRATLTKNKKGEINRGICDTPWGNDDTKESFYRDSILEWYYPNDKVNYLHEVVKAEKDETVMPYMTCSRTFSDGKTAVAYSNGKIIIS